MTRRLIMPARALALLIPLALLAACSPSKIVQRRITPHQPFDLKTVPAAPDYAQAASWAALPDRADKADLFPEGIENPDRQATAQVDTFFIHPTTFYSGSGWNQPLDDIRANELTDNIILTSMAGAFNSASRVYAPRYRQATLASYYGDNDSSRSAFGLAYGDVQRAFEYYLEHYNHGRPFILASHSQGSMHAMRLLETIDSSPVRNRLVAAYVVGYRLPEEKFGTSYKAIGPCKGPRDTGCINSWDTWSSDGEIQRTSKTVQWYGDRLETFGAKKIHCTNPISWTIDGQNASAEQHLGAINPPSKEQLPSASRIIFGSGSLGMNFTRIDPPIPHFTSAQCQDGLLVIPPVKDERFNRFTLSKGNYHNVDYGMFYMSIRHNAEERVVAWLEAHPAVAGN